MKYTNDKQDTEKDNNNGDNGEKYSDEYTNNEIDGDPQIDHLGRIKERRRRGNPVRYIDIYKPQYDLLKLFT